MQIARFVARGVLMSFIASLSGCALEEETDQAATQEAEAASTNADVDDASSADDAAVASTALAESDLLALPVCDWVAFFSGGSVPMFRPTNTVDCRLFIGTGGAGVRQLQHSMNRCYGERLVEDGDFGPATEAAMKRTQRTARVLDDGEYGPVTRKAMLHDRIGGGCIRVP